MKIIGGLLNCCESCCPCLKRPSKSEIDTKVDDTAQQTFNQMLNQSQIDQLQFMNQSQMNQSQSDELWLMSDELWLMNQSQNNRYLGLDKYDPDDLSKKTS